MPLLLNHSEPIHWALAGAAIGAITLLLLFLSGKRLGISGGLEDVCSLVLRRVPYFSREARIASTPWRLPFLGGLLLGGVLSALVSGGWAPSMDMGLFDERIGWGPEGKVAWMFVGGLLIGFGTRLSGGCTSGHGIFGLSNFEASGLVATLSFMAAGLATTTLVYRVLWAG